MPRQLWNQGRVVGLSAYEIYVRQHMADKNKGEPATEVEWLAASIGSGSSMLFKYGPDNTEGLHVVDIPMPENSRLCAASTVIGSLFHGHGHYETDSVWADRIDDYGILVANDAMNHPTGDVLDSQGVPSKIAEDGEDWNRVMEKQLREYVRIVDGNIIQPGRWVDTALDEPAADLQMNTALAPTVRLLVAGPIDEQIEILLTGFTIRSVVSGVSGISGSILNPNHTEDGSFLGPGIFPWSTKIVFSVSTSTLNAFFLDKYRRKIPNTDPNSVIVDDNAIIDMRKTDPQTYYQDNHADAAEPINVDEFHTMGEGASVLTVFQRSELYPPALFGTYVTEEGADALYPLDVVAPGTLKMFSSKHYGDIVDYESTFPASFAMFKDDAAIIAITNRYNTLVPIAKVENIDLDYVEENYGSQSGAGAPEPCQTAEAMVITTGDKKGIALAVGNGAKQWSWGVDAGNFITVGNTSADVGNLTKVRPSSSNITWAGLVQALRNNMSIDVLGNDLKMIKAGMARGGNYIQYGNGLRLYISPTEPTDKDVPVGSIGIGWFDEDDVSSGGSD